MNQSRIEQSIEEIYAFIEECKASKLYPNKVVVAKDELYDLIDALRLCAPEEIKRYKKIINNRDEIINEAHKRAEDMVNNAQAQTAQLLDQSELVQAAYDRADELMEEATKQAEQIVEAANAEAEQVRSAAIYYTNDLLTMAQRSIQESLTETNSKYRMLTSALQSSLDTITSNKEELMPTPMRQERTEEESADEVAAADENQSEAMEKEEE